MSAAPLVPGRQPPTEVEKVKELGEHTTGAVLGVPVVLTALQVL